MAKHDDLVVPRLVLLGSECAAKLGTHSEGGEIISCDEAGDHSLRVAESQRDASGAATRSAKVDPADRSPLSNALRAWRTARARADEVSPFIVFHDSTIEAIAASRPRSIAELRRVPGVGPMKLDRYGEEIIGVVATAD